jgi:hypothetical protein
MQKRFVSIITCVLLWSYTHCYGVLTLHNFNEGALFVEPSVTENSVVFFIPPSQNIQFVNILESTSNETINLPVTPTPTLPLFTGNIFNYPNPFSMRTGTRIGYQLNQEATIELRIYSLSGHLYFQKIFPPTEEGGKAKYNHITIDTSTLNGTWLNPGIYIYTILNNGKVLAKNKMVVTP